LLRIRALIYGENKYLDTIFVAKCKLISYYWRLYFDLSNCILSQETIQIYGNPTTKTVPEMENYIFLKAGTKVNFDKKNFCLFEFSINSIQSIGGIFFFCGATYITF